MVYSCDEDKLQGSIRKFSVSEVAGSTKIWKPDPNLPLEPQIAAFRAAQGIKQPNVGPAAAKSKSNPVARAFRKFLK